MPRFKRYKPATTPTIPEIDIANYEDILDAFGEGKTVVQLSAERFVPFNVIKGAYEDIEEIIATVERCMRGESIQSDDGEGSIIYYPKPTSENGLKTVIRTVVVRDFLKKRKGNYNSTNPADFMNIVDAIIDRIISNSDGEGNGVWDEFETYF